MENRESIGSRVKCCSMPPRHCLLQSLGRRRAFDDHLAVAAAQLWDEGVFPDH